VFTRQVNYAKFGSAVLRAIHTMKPTNEEEDDLEVDFLAMVGDGITYNTRRDQLRFITNEDGSEFELDDRGEKKPRGSFALRKYATDENGPVKADAERVAFMSNADLVKLILEAEKEAGIVIPANEMKKQKKAAAATEAPPPKEAKTMGKISIRGNKGGGVTLPNKAGGGTKTAAPATKKKVDTGNGEEAAAEPASGAPSADIDMGAIAGLISEEVGKAVADQTKALKKELKGAVTAIESAVAELRTAMTKQHTVQHDVILQHVYQALAALQSEQALGEVNLDEVQLLPQGYDIEAYDTEGGDASGEASS
jgi:hypothetical protein